MHKRAVLCKSLVKFELNLKNFCFPNPVEHMNDMD